MPIIQPNNTTGLYGIDTTVQINNAVTGNSLNIQGNATISGNLAVGGAITAAGNIAGNYILGNGSQLTGLPEVYGNANVSAYLASGTNTANMITTGNIAGTYFLGNGSQLTGIQADYGNANVTSLLANFGSNTISTTGNIGGGNIIGTHVGSGAALSSITGANVTGTVANATFATTAGSSGSATTALTAGTVTTAAQPNITSVGTLTSVSSSGNITGANITGTHFGSGAALSNLTGANVTGTVPSATSATTAGTVTTAAQPNITSVGTLTSLSVTGNITGGNINTGGNVQAAFFKGNGSQLTGVTATTTAIQNGTSSVGIPTTDGNINLTVAGFGSGSTPAMQILAGNGAAFINSELIVDGDVRVIANGIVSAQGNVTGGNLRTAGQVSAGGNILGARISSTGNIVAAGNIACGNLSADLIVSAPIVNGGTGNFSTIGTDTIATNGLADIGGDLEVAGNITAPISNISGGNLTATGSGAGFIRATANISAGGNIISTGYITAAGNITSTGNIAGNFFIGNGSLLTGITTTYGNANVAAYMATFLPTYTGDLAGDDLFLNTATGNAYIQASNINTSIIRVTGSAVVGSNSGDGLTTPGTLTANTITANTSVATAALTASTTVSATGNITGGNINTAGLVSATGTVTAGGNITGGNINTAGLVSATGNITGGNINTAGLVSATGNLVSNSGVVVVATGRYRGDFSAAPISRTVFQSTSTATTATTFLTAVPGPAHVAGPTVTGAATGLFSSNDVGNASIFGMYSQGSDARIWSLNSGTGNVNNMTFRFGTAGNLAATLTAAGNFSAVGNVQGGNILGIGSSLTGINAFGNVAVAGQTTVSADNTTDTLTLVAGTNITITTDAANNRVTITSSGGGETISPLLLMGG